MTAPAAPVHQPVADAAGAIAAAQALYDASADRLRAALHAYAKTGVAPSDEDRAAGAFVYPELRAIYAPTGPEEVISSAFGKFNTPGVYATSLTKPAMFRDYLDSQLSLLLTRHGEAVRLVVGPSGDEIPYPYVMGKSEETALAQADPRELARLFPAPDLERVSDHVADGATPVPGAPAPLSLFDAPRVDYSLARIEHYTGGSPDHAQDFVLLTNYQRYVDEFIAWALTEIRGPGPYSALVLPGGVQISAGMAVEEAEAAIAGAPSQRFQMPAYHAIAPGKAGISLINIGVGPSNAKTMTDHLAVLRPQCWLMVGHCGGLRHAQRLGDYVLAHAYLRRDGVLDEHLPLDAPIPAIAEVQVALQDAARAVTGETGPALKTRLRTGTVVTYADRNWELRADQARVLFNQSRAIAVDMESATIAANGYRFRVPYGTLLCVSDKPLHGELKLPGPARRFYERAVAQHLQIGIAALELLKRDGAASLHSRKLRAFDEPAFR